MKKENEFVVTLNAGIYLPLLQPVCDKMYIKLKEQFISLQKKYFNKAELPITIHYGNDNGSAIK